MPNMILKLGDEFYDGMDEPFMLILTENDKHLLSSMAEDDFKYCVWSAQKYTVKEIDKWMSEDNYGDKIS